MKKIKTLDGYHVYQIKRNKNLLFLADKMNYKTQINKMLDTLDDLKFDSIIFLFGIDTGEYIEELNKLLCVKNKVYIFEPNKAIYKKYNSKITPNIQLILFEEKIVKEIIENTINLRNMDNIYFHSFGNYRQIYEKEYNYLIEHLDWTLINVASQLGLAKRFKEIFIQNMIANIKVLEQCTPIHHYIYNNLNVPAIIVSGGPSLDKNIEDMLKYKKKLKKCFIITGTRSVNALIKNHIMPDMIVSVDPVDANLNMMKECLDLENPFAFYEYSNRYLVRDYKGDKIYISALFSQTIEAFKNLRGVYCGGSVAHACIDIANIMGCSPILLVGQDFAHTNQKHHAESAIFDYDETIDYREQFLVKDVYGNQVGTTITLDHYRKRLEQYIDIFKDEKRIKFINCSYGAQIKGAPHKEIGEVLEQMVINKRKKGCTPNKNIKIKTKETIDEILEFIEEYIEKANLGIELCETITYENQTKSLADVEEDDMDLQRVLCMLDIINNFENATKCKYLGGYFTLFVYEMKKNSLNMYAKDYEKLTSDLQYQACSLNTYFEKMMEMLVEVKKTILETVLEFYE